MRLFSVKSTATTATSKGRRHNNCDLLIVNSVTAQRDFANYFNKDFIIELAKWNYSHAIKRKDIK